MTKTTRIAALATLMGLAAVAAGAGINSTVPTFERTHATPAMQAAHPEFY